MPDLLTPKQLAEYLQLSQRTVYRLLERDRIPAIRVGGQWRFRKSAVDFWLDVHMERLADADLHAITADPERTPDLASLLDPVNALIRVTPGSPQEVVQDFVRQVRFGESVDLDHLIQRILEREALCSTALPDGVALLHTDRWRPRLLKACDVVAVGRLAAPIDFGALDGARTDLLMLLLARDERTHLQVLAKMTRLCRERDVCDMLRRAPTADAVVAGIAAAERRVFAPPQAEP